MKQRCMSGYRVTWYVVAATGRQPETFETERLARVRACELARRNAVKLYQVTGEPVTDLWRRPVLVDEWSSVRQLSCAERLAS
jgi:hypothetical protein